MEIIILWFGLSVVVGIVASSKGRSGFGYFLLALLLSPLIGGILALALPSKKGVVVAGAEVASEETHVRCPDCRELVRADARKCKHCGTALTPQIGATTTEIAPAAPVYIRPRPEAVAFGARLGRLVGRLFRAR